MKYRVVVQPTAQAEIEAACRWRAERSAQGAAKWFNGLQAAILSLDSNPERCSLAPESEFFKHEIHQLLYGKRSGIYRILFTIEQNTVMVLHVRHGARQIMKPTEDDET